MKSFVFLFLVALLVVSTSRSHAQQAADPDFERVVTELKAGHTDKAIEALTAVLKKHPALADAYLLRGNLRLSSNDAAGALADFNKTIQLKPTMGEAYNERALVRMMAQDLVGATRDLDLALANGFINDGVYSLRAQLRRQQGDLKGAIADFDESLKLNPNNPQTYAYRGALLLETGEPDRALSDLNYLISWYETEPNKHRENKPTLTIMAPERETKSEGLFAIGIENKTVNQAPGDKETLPIVASAYRSRGLIQSARDKADAAIADFTKSIRLDSQNVWAYYNRANELEQKGDFDAALADVNRAIQLDPMNGNLRVEHGVILTIMGKTQEAKIDFDMLLKGDPKLWQKRIDERLEAVKKKAPQNNP